MADERLGNLTKEQLTELRSELTLFQDGVKDLGDAMSKLGKNGNLGGLAENFNKSRNAVQVIAKMSAETLATAKGQQELEREILKVKKDITQSETNQAIIQERLKRARGAERSDLTRALALETARGVQLKEAASSAGKLAEETKKVVDVGKGLDSIGKMLAQIPILGGPLSSIFTDAAASARAFAKEGVSPVTAKLLGTQEALRKLFVAGIGPAIISSSEQVGSLNKQLGLGLEGSRKVADNFRSISQNAESTRINTSRLVAANGELAKSLGASVQYSEQQLQTYIQNTEYLGASADAAAKIEKLSINIGVNSEEYSQRMASAANSAGKNLGIHMPLSQIMEKIKDASATTLLNLRGNPEALTKTVLLSEKLGMSFQQLRNTANNLLDFESSISNELEAELLVGRELNLERARAAALTGNDLVLMQELSNQVGTLNDYTQMNVIQRESLAQAFGMTADQMGDMLLKQDMMNKLGDKARDASIEQLKAAKELAKEKYGGDESKALLEIQRQETVGKQFQDTILKLKEVFVDIVSKVEPYVKALADLIATAAASPIAKVAMTAGVGVSAAISLAKLVMSTVRGTDMMPMVVRMAGTPGGGGTSWAPTGTGFGGKFYSAGTVTSKKGEVFAANSTQGKMIQTMSGQKPVGRGLTAGGAMGIAAIGGLAGGMMMNSENEGMQMMGSALTGASSGAMMGMMFGPIGAGIGAAIGGGMSLLTAYLEKKSKEEQELKDREARKKAEDNDYYKKVYESLEKSANQKTNIYLDTVLMSNTIQQFTPGVE